MATSMKIAALVPYGIYPAKMGGQKAIAHFYAALCRLEPITLFSNTENKLAGPKEYSILPLLSTSKFRYCNPFLFFSFKKEIKKSGITHLIIEHPYFGWLGLLLKNTLRLKLIVRSHNIEANRFKSMGKWWWPFLYRYEGWVHRNADCSFFITEEDRQFATEMYRVSSKKTVTITYGIDTMTIPENASKIVAKNKLHEMYSIPSNHKILLFNGTLDYSPNEIAITAIVEKINPLLQETNNNYSILICGKNLPQHFDGLKKYADQNIIFAGFVSDIQLHYEGADMFINPVITGGGIKTKLVEALSANLTSISTKNGAIGIPEEIVKGKLLISEDLDWNKFVDNILVADLNRNTSADFYSYFNWNQISLKANKTLLSL